MLKRIKGIKYLYTLISLFVLLSTYTYAFNTTTESCNKPVYSGACPLYDNSNPLIGRYVSPLNIRSNVSNRNSTTSSPPQDSYSSYKQCKRIDYSFYTSNGSYISYHKDYEIQKYEEIDTVKNVSSYSNANGTYYNATIEINSSSELHYVVCTYCPSPSEPTPTPPEDTNTTHWELIGSLSCSDKNAILPETCTKSNGSNILLQSWKTGCCGENTKCWQSTPICDENQTLDMNATPPVCVDNTPTCDQNDTAFPPLKTHESVIFAPWTLPSDLPTLCSDRQGEVQEKRVSCVSNYRCMCPYTPYTKEIAENETVFFTWYENSPIDKSALCEALHGTVDHERANCVTTYRCVGKTEDKPKECNEAISSYVSPRDQSFHEDIPLDGVDFGLHYDSAEWNSTEVAHGWSVSSHAKLVGDRVHYGSGVVRVVDTSTVENNLTVIKSGSNEMLFDVNGTLQSIRDLYTKETKTTFGYDNVGRLITLTDIYEEITTLERDTNGMVTAIVAPTGQRTLLSIDDNGDLIEVQYEDSSSYAFEYERHLMTVETEPKGNRFLHFFDDAGNVVKVIDAEQGEWLFGSNTADSYGSHTVTRASGDVIIYKNHFLENNTTLKTEKILPTGDIVLYENTIDDSRSSTTSCGMKTINIYKKNADGTLYKDPVTEKRVLEQSITTTPNGLSQTTNYTKNYIFGTDNSVVAIKNITTRNGASSTNLRDYNQSTQTITSPEGRVSTTTYNEHQQPVKTQIANFKPVTYTYDDKGRLIKTKQGKRIMRYSYNEQGYLEESYNKQRDTKTTYSYDLLGRVTQITYPDQTTERFEYDNNGNQIKRTIPTPADHTFTYNGVNKRTGYTSPEEKQTTYTYDKQRRVTKITKPSGKSIETTYTDGRVTAVTTPESTTNYSYTCQSNIESINKGSENFSFTYDGTLVTSIIQAGVLNQTLNYSYNNEFQVDSFTYANKTENYNYDKDGLLTGSGDYTITRNAENGLIQSIGDGNLNTTFTYNNFGDLKTQKSKNFKLALKRKEARIVNKEEKLINRWIDKRGKAKKKTTRTIFHYSYDERDRLIKVEKGKKKNRTTVEEYRYDANGNREWANIYGVISEGSYTLDDNLVVYGQNTYKYDEDGYLSEKTTPEGSTAYSYGTLRELKEVVTPTHTIAYQQNALNQRVAKLVDGVVVEKYLWADLTTLLAVYDANDNLIQRFEYADQRMPVAMTDESGTKHYLHYDQVGSLRAVSETNGNIVKIITYDTFGNILTDSNPSLKVPFGFAGGLYDHDTKLTRFGYRDYDAYTGKWTAKDPIGFDGGDSNLYGYVLGDPVNFTDSIGLDWLSDTANFSAGIGDALLLGFGGELRDLLDIGGVDKCSDAYTAGSWTSFAFGGLRLTYAGLAKAGSIFAPTGQAASLFRDKIKLGFRLGFGKNFRKPNLAGKTDSQIRSSAGRTNKLINSYGAGVTTGGALGAECGCK